MRMLVMFDLPTETGEDKRNYRIFRKALLKNGFFMLQESVYCRLLLTPSSESVARNAVSSAKPPKGLVQLLCVTEKQFAKMTYLVGTHHSEVIDSDERVVIL
ncbi:MAG: CRISPR-associated endonuclease Cas2 [Lachnospiraceae bacterium]|nr:CRISPR-associated endonuclease Cas2 [Lachnospiraceae bacterium]